MTGFGNKYRKNFIKILDKAIRKEYTIYVKNKKEIFIMEEKFITRKEQADRLHKFFYDDWGKQEKEGLYRVVRDSQGGEFGMGRDYTIEQWILQAMGWADTDDNDIEFDYLSKMTVDESALDEIGDFWQIEFAKAPKRATTLEDCLDKINREWCNWDTGYKDLINFLYDIGELTGKKKEINAVVEELDKIDREA